MDGISRALVTGASSGIGAAFARQLAARDSNLVVVARDGERLEQLAHDLGGLHGIDCEVLVADLTDHEACERVAARIGDDASAVDLVVNNAGFGTSGRFVRQVVEEEHREIELNVVALHRLTHAAVQTMVARGQGGVINVSSLGGYQPTPGFATYAATKAFVSSFTQAVHEELLGTGVKAMVLCPGFTRTEFQQRAGAGAEASNLPGFMWQEADEVVLAALRDYDRGRAVSVPGPLNTAAAVFATMAPGIAGRKVAAAMLRR